MTLKTWAFSLGLAMALVGMALNLRWVVWVALGLLAVAFLLRFFNRRSVGES